MTIRIRAGLMPIRIRASGTPRVGYQPAFTPL